MRAHGNPKVQKCLTTTLVIPNQKKTMLTNVVYPRINLALGDGKHTIKMVMTRGWCTTVWQWPNCFSLATAPAPLRHPAWPSRSRRHAVLRDTEQRGPPIQHSSQWKGVSKIALWNCRCYLSMSKDELSQQRLASLAKAWAWLKWLKLLVTQPLFHPPFWALHPSCCWLDPSG